MIDEILILRGLPGCGKSYFAEQLAHGRRVLTVSADDYFTHAGEYAFNPALLSAAHSDCFRRFLKAVQAKHKVAEVLIVDNTNMTRWELAPYVTVAQAFEIPFQVVSIMCPTWLSARRNVHGVPAATIERMAKNYEPALPWWNETVVQAEW